MLFDSWDSNYFTDRCENATGYCNRYSTNEIQYLFISFEHTQKPLKSYYEVKSIRYINTHAHAQRCTFLHSMKLDHTSPREKKITFIVTKYFIGITLILYECLNRIFPSVIRINASIWCNKLVHWQMSIQRLSNIWFVQFKLFRWKLMPKQPENRNMQFGTYLSTATMHKPVDTITS